MFTQIHCETLSFVGSQLISLNSLAPICARLSSFKQYLIHLFCDIWIFFKSRLFKGSCYISSFKFKSYDQFNTPQTASNFRHLLSCGTIESGEQYIVVSRFSSIFPGV